MKDTAPPIRAQPLGRARIWEEQGDAEGGGGGGQQDWEKQALAGVLD
ncbi:MAG TPA: hypothetical protein VKP30_21920 [Polyangiaceae bacterium]|nr:hypothetical protein [Polyangiaceae bacterium]